MVSTPDIAPTVTSTNADFATFGAIHLDVTDGERSLGFWRDLVGLDLLSVNGDVLHLGVAGRDLIVLHPGAGGPVVREAAGLYHLSFHLPSLEDFACAFARLEAADYFQYPTDHGTHLANYVDDPDGIGLEFAFETTSEQRVAWNGLPGFEHNDDGDNWSARDPRYVAWLRFHASNGDTRIELPAGTVVGHIHLRAADLDAALAFYRDAIGFTVNSDGRPKGFFDMSAGGTFPHRLACNNWESAGHPQRPAGTAGMRAFTLQFRSADALERAIAYLEAAGNGIDRQPGDALVTDPSGTRLLLTTTRG
ncbi:MAG TPA: VOC family protein [Thermomicrobiales bacterium]|nr:VOC family protein [Thermomicrobiales bacterium]